MVGGAIGGVDVGVLVIALAGVDVRVSGAVVRAREEGVEVGVLRGSVVVVGLSRRGDGWEVAVVWVVEIALGVDDDCGGFVAGLRCVRWIEDAGQVVGMRGALHGGPRWSAVVQPLPLSICLFRATRASRPAPVRHPVRFVRSHAFRVLI